MSNVGGGNIEFSAFTVNKIPQNEQALKKISETLSIYR